MKRAGRGPDPIRRALVLGLLGACVLVAGECDVEPIAQGVRDAIDAIGHVASDLPHVDSQVWFDYAANHGVSLTSSEATTQLGAWSGLANVVQSRIGHVGDQASAATKELVWGTACDAFEEAITGQRPDFGKLLVQNGFVRLMGSLAPLGEYAAQAQATYDEIERGVPGDAATDVARLTIMCYAAGRSPP